MLRLRIATEPPLAPLKALFLVAASSRSIEDLKAQLVEDLAPLRSVQAGQLVLEVDGWELLDASRVELVREEDIISIKLKESAAGFAPVVGTALSTLHMAPVTSSATPAATSSPGQKKRKRAPPSPSAGRAEMVVSPGASLPASTTAAAARPPFKKMKHSKALPASPVVTSVVAFSDPAQTQTASVSEARAQTSTKPVPTQPAPQSESSSSEEESDSDSSSSAGSDASSDGDSSSSNSSGPSSSSSSSASSAPSIKSSKAPALVAPATRAAPKSTVARPSSTIQLTPIVPLQPPVPPGLGSTATKERNLRRRAKKKALRGGKAAPANGGPLSGSTPALAPMGTTPPTPSADAEREASQAYVDPPAFLSTQPNQIAPTAEAVAAAREQSSAAPDLTIAFTTSANRNKSKAFRKAALLGLSGFKTVFDSPSEGSAPSPSPVTASPTPAAASTSPAPSVPALATPTAAKLVTQQRQPQGDVPLYSAVAPPASYTTSTSAASGKKNKKGRASVASHPSTPRPHMPAPSDRPPASLPPRMFVTSVDVEDPVWEASVGGGAWAAYLGLEESKIKEQVWEKGAMELDYGADEPAALPPPNPIAANDLSVPPAPATLQAAQVPPVGEATAAHTAHSTAANGQLDWDGLERAYESSAQLPWESLHVGSEFTYKELILDPTTFSPSLALHHGTVKSVSEEAATLLVQARYAEPAGTDDEEAGDYYDGDGSTSPAEDALEEKAVSRSEWSRGDWRAAALSSA